MNGAAPPTNTHCSTDFSSVRSWGWRVLLAGVATVIAVEAVVIVPRLEVVALIATPVWMMWPGVVLGRRVFATSEPTGVAAWLVGPALGMGWSVFGVLLLWAAGLQNWLAILLGPALTWALTAAAGRFGGPALRLPTFSRRDVVAVSLVLLVVPIVTWAPYAHVREPVQGGEAYRAYFTADFVWAMTVTTEIAKGEMPPVNPFIQGMPLRYYWMAHMLSGAVYRNVRAWEVTAEQVVLVNGLAFGLMGAAFLYGLARIAGATPGWAAIAITAAYLANSYEGINRLWVLYLQHAPYEGLKFINIDAVTRWFYQGMPVDGLQRMLLYQPHHLTGYMLGLSALWLVGFAEDVTETSVPISAGTLLGLGFLYSTFTTIIIGAAVGALMALRLLARHTRRRVWQSAILAALPALGGVAVCLLLGYADPRQGPLVVFGPNPVAFRRWPLMLVLSFGPLLVGGLVGLARFRWVGRDGTAAAMLAASAFAFYFFTDVPDEQGVWVGWRAGHLLLIAFAVSGAAALTAAWRLSAVRLPLALLTILVLTPAIPTTAIDVYNAQDISNRRQGPGFPWTLVVTPLEREALEWIRRSTPEEAIVQFEPEARGAGWWCFITAFAERRMAAGLPGAMIPRRPYELASQTVRDGIFKARSAEDAYTIAAHFGIDYLFTGVTERHFYRPAIIQMEKAPQLFPQVFRNETVTVFQVRRSGRHP